MTEFLNAPIKIGKTELNLKGSDLFLPFNEIFMISSFENSKGVHVKLMVFTECAVPLIIEARYESFIEDTLSNEELDECIAIYSAPIFHLSADMNQTGRETVGNDGEVDFNVLELVKVLVVRKNCKAFGNLSEKHRNMAIYAFLQQLIPKYRMKMFIRGFENGEIENPEESIFINNDKSDEEDEWSSSSGRM